MPLFKATCDDLERWAGKPARRVAQDSFPRLIRLLVFATNSTLTEIQFPTGDSVIFSGWDGVTVTTATSPFVPAGVTVWELGTTTDYKDKAWDDYSKRKNELAGPKGIPLNQCTFIFITPRRWVKKDGPKKHQQTKDNWVKARLKDKIWADVKVYDADDLENWLEHAPAVTEWFLRECGRPNRVYALDQWLREWLYKIIPPIEPDRIMAAVLSNISEKDQLWKRIKEWLDMLGRPSTAFSVPFPDYTHSPKILLMRSALEKATIARVLAQFSVILLSNLSANERDKLLACTVIVETPEAWREMMQHNAPLIMIPLFGHDGVVIAAAKDYEHHVLLLLEEQGEWPESLVFCIEVIESTLKY